jgi:hypothetical protein
MRLEIAATFLGQDHAHVLMLAPGFTGPARAGLNK